MGVSAFFGIAFGGTTGFGVWKKVSLRTSCGFERPEPASLFLAMLADSVCDARLGQERVFGHPGIRSNLSTSVTRGRTVLRSYETNQPW